MTYPSLELMDSQDVGCDSALVKGGSTQERNVAESVLEGLDSYMDDLNDGLVVSRMVMTSIMNGAVLAVEQEAADRLAEKNGDMVNWKPTSDGAMEWAKNLNGISKAYEELESLLRKLLLLNNDDDEDDDRSHRRTISPHAVSPPVFKLDTNGCVEDLELGHSPLMNMSKEDIIKHFNAVIKNMNRENESKLQEITEDYFARTRELLREKESSQSLKRGSSTDLLKSEVSKSMMKLKHSLEETSRWVSLKTHDGSGSSAGEGEEEEEIWALYGLQISDSIFSTVMEASRAEREHEMLETEKQKLVSSVIEKDILMVALLEEGKVRLLDSCQNIYRLKRKQQISADEESKRMEAELLRAAERNEQCVREIRSLEIQLQTGLMLVEEREREYRRKLESVAVFSQGLCLKFAKFQDGVVRAAADHELRLEASANQLKLLVGKAGKLVWTVGWFKKVLEGRLSDLNKAETEVDLLGNQVESLSHLLEKLYVGLDLYSSVLQHYPGIADVLRLIKQGLMSTGTKQA